MGVDFPEIGQELTMDWDSQKQEIKGKIKKILGAEWDAADGISVHLKCSVEVTEVTQQLRRVK